jgi:ribose transport system permease protein
MSTRTHSGAPPAAGEENQAPSAPEQAKAKRAPFKGIETYRIAGVVSALIAVFVIFTILEPSFISLDNVSEIVVQSSIIAVVALGMTLVIVTGGIDLSVGSIVAVVSVVCATNLPTWGTPLTILIGLALGAAMGFLNGAFTAYVGLASFIVTLATLNLFRGFAFLYTDGKPIFSLADSFRNVFAGALFGIQIPILLVLVITGLCAVMLSSTRMGLALRAVGSNADASRKSGVRVKRAQAAAFVLSGLLSALAALMLMGRVGAAEPITGTGYELIAIAAVVVGGTSLMGGRASVVGTLLGALLLGAIRTGLTLHNVNPYVSYVVTGLIILIAVLVDRFISRKQRIA